MITVEIDNIDEVEAYIFQQENLFYDEIVDSLRKKGQSLVDKARAKTATPDGFNNITWNLRSSIGMCLVDEKGIIVETYFPAIGKGAHGDMIGRELAAKLAIYAREINDISMVFVAAEEYATFVQAKGKDVIEHVIGNSLESELRELID
ncbi:hypothetical protein A0256_23140 [Mucilaginibacter sp. PAMC 26640]|nr:hypothetical protein A0256_23140 [Mucilaginibacter sp. PAMC 26640]